MPAKSSTEQKKKKAAAASDAGLAADGPTFEEALEALEALVDEMEGDELPLEKMIVGYERGVELRAICEKRLEQAQAKVELIRERGGSAGAGGEVELEDFDPAAASADRKGQAAPDNKKASARAASERAADAATETGESDGELF